MERGAHYSHLEIGRRTMNSLTRVAKDTLVIEIYEHNDNAISARMELGGCTRCTPARHSQSADGKVIIL